MKVTAVAATLFALTAVSTAAPATRRVRRQAPSGLDVIGSVNSWTNDVIQVNSFLDTASTLSGDDLAAAAQTAFGFASDEPNQLMLEAGLAGLSQAGLDAAADLMQVFQAGVLDQLQNIISDPTNTDLVTASGKLSPILEKRMGANAKVQWPPSTLRAACVSSRM